MPTEAPSTSTGSVLSPRAAIAQLTLELRASLQEVAASDADEARVDRDAAVAQLRARLAPLIAARRASLDQALARVRAESAAAVAEARLEAAAMVATASSRLEAKSVEVVKTTIEDHVVSVYDELAPGEVSTVELYRPAPWGAPTVNIVIDAEAFARVIATVLGEHLAAGSVGTAAVAPPPQPSLKHARHLDVLLVGIATLIVLVILAAWIG
jgi:multidrug efflux pump subunit AcrA (membrane-fusion protein)